MSASVPVSVLLHRAEDMRESWLANECSRFTAQALEGIAHDTACSDGECEDSTVTHLREWVASARAQEEE